MKIKYTIYKIRRAKIIDYSQEDSDFVNLNYLEEIYSFDSEEEALDWANGSFCFNTGEFIIQKVYSRQ